MSNHTIGELVLRTDERRNGRIYLIIGTIIKIEESEYPYGVIWNNNGEDEYWTHDSREIVYMKNNLREYMNE